MDHYLVSFGIEIGPQIWKAIGSPGRITAKNFLLAGGP
jgi:hypothetical protein